ncbi:hypothetical protein D915_009571 [Fasciola hepatica]|uniref:Uncharacterized protein n=1 Tax=Fasciola hepatica TaxID=6192 RepID=A0A4E0RN39_FASHE|nr:hypothetical protein D915_009571 [Fasciola hepatica]
MSFRGDRISGNLREEMTRKNETFFHSTCALRLSDHNIDKKSLKVCELALRCWFLSENTFNRKNKLSSLLVNKKNHRKKNPSKFSGSGVSSKSNELAILRAFRTRKKGFENLCP